MTDTSSFFNSGIPAVKFESHGDKVTGQVLDKEQRQQTDFDTGKPLYWEDGRPRKQLVVTLKVAEPTDEDDGERNLYIRGLMTKAVTEAVRANRLRDLEIGHWLTVEYVGDAEPARKGVNGAKQYKAMVETDHVPF